jgi:outer membrane protein W
MKKIISIVAFLSFAFFGVVQAQAQDQPEPERTYAPQKNDITVSVNFGVGSYISKSAPAPDLSSYSLSAPMTTWFDKKPMLDLEGKWFVTDKWAIKLTGALAAGKNPAYNEVTGTSDSDATFELGDLPTYKAVPSSANIQYSVAVGADHYWSTKNERLFLRAGGEVGFAYGRVSVNGVDSEEYLGAAIGEAYALRVAPVVGLDYYFAKELFVGIDVRPISYQYSVYSERPQVGLGLLSSDNHSFSLIAQPTIKLGFRF